MELGNDVREYVVINTVEYNDDGRWTAQSAKLGELESLGFTSEEVLGISWISIGESFDMFDRPGVVVVRVA